MLPKAVGMHLDRGCHGGTLCDGGRSMEWDWVWLELTGVGVVEGTMKWADHVKAM